MSGFRLAPEAEADLDEIWLRVAHESGSMEIATRAVEKIAERFWLLARYPYMGRKRDEDLRPGLRSFPADNYLIIHRIDPEKGLLILRIIHGSRDISTLVEPDV